MVQPAPKTAVPAKITDENVKKRGHLPNIYGYPQYVPSVFPAAVECWEAHACQNHQWRQDPMTSKDHG